MASGTASLQPEMRSLISQAAELIVKCDAILFTSGAGMGVSSGLGTFRGINAGVWPPLLKHPDLDFTDMSNPTWFHAPQGNSDQHDTANFGYAFWAYRYQAYTQSAPHVGYTIAKQWSDLKNVRHAFSFTSNIDGHWINSGWDPTTVYECHGSIHYMQCVNSCRKEIWETNHALDLAVDPATDCAVGDLPHCPHCKGLARPNVLMFGDSGFLSLRERQQMVNFQAFTDKVASLEGRLLIVELGAGTAVPTVRMRSEQMFTDRRWTADLIRINPSEQHAAIDRMCKSTGNGQTVQLTLDALTALTMIDEAVQKKIKSQATA